VTALLLDSNGVAVRTEPQVPPRPHAPRSADPSPASRYTASCRVVVTVLLVAVAGLVFLALASRLVGFQGHVVVSGSMAPQLVPGDVVLTRPIAPQDLQPGQVLLFPDPQDGDRLLVHRLVSFDDQGLLVTRGDANQSNDSAHVPATSVIGAAQVRVPHVGLPAYWRTEGRWDLVGLTAALLAAATVFASGWSRGQAGDGRGRTTADRVLAPRGRTTADRLRAPAVRAVV
jgi:signal peptidase